MLRSTLLLSNSDLPFVHDADRGRSVNVNHCPPDPDRPRISTERRHALKEKGQYPVTLNIVASQAERKKSDEKSKDTHQYLAAQNP
ncbi:MAG: hypothetical protein V3W44_07885 [Dehalococcoidales bacterium]